MINREFLNAGHPPTLFAAFFYFDISFMVWALLGPLGVQIAAELHLDAAQKGRLGYSKQFTGTYQAGLPVFPALALVAVVGLTRIKSRWRTTWGAIPGVARI
jgi:nitrate/nitrite transporter NarK